MDYVYVFGELGLRFSHSSGEVLRSNIFFKTEIDFYFLKV